MKKTAMGSALAETTWTDAFRRVRNRIALVATAICVAATPSPSYAAAPVDGGEWAIGAGETETLDAAATISRLAVDGSLTLGAGAALTANGAVVNCISTGDGMVADMTIASGASFASQGNLTGANPGNTQGFSVGTYGGTGTVTVASGVKATYRDGGIALLYGGIYIIVR